MNKKKHNEDKDLALLRQASKWAGNASKYLERWQTDDPAGTLARHEAIRHLDEAFRWIDECRYVQRNPNEEEVIEDV